MTPPPSTCNRVAAGSQLGLRQRVDGCCRPSACDGWWWNDDDAGGSFIAIVGAGGPAGASWPRRAAGRRGQVVRQAHQARQALRQPLSLEETTDIRSKTLTLNSPGFVSLIELQWHGQPSVDPTRARPRASGSRMVYADDGGSQMATESGIIRRSRPRIRSLHRADDRQASPRHRQ